MGSTIARLSRLFGAVGFLGSCEDALSPDAATFAKSGSSKLAPPSGTDAIPMLSDRVDVFWTDNSTNEGGFRVERSTNGGGTWVSAGTTGPGQTWSFDDGRESEQQVCYRAFAFNARGDSGPSETDCTAPPAAPTGLSGMAVDDQTIKLQWDDNSSVEDSYVIWLSTPEDFYPMETLPKDTRTARVPRYGSAFAYAVAAGRDGGISDFACCVWADAPSASRATSLLTMQRRIPKPQDLFLKRHNPTNRR